MTLLYNLYIILYFITLPTLCTLHFVYAPPLVLADNPANKPADKAGEDIFIGGLFPIAKVARDGRLAQLDRSGARRQVGGIAKGVYSLYIHRYIDRYTHR